MKLDNWHYSIFEQFNNLIFGKTLTSNNFFDDGRVHQMSRLFQIDEDGDYSEQTFQNNPQDLFFFKFVKGNEFYLLPRRHLEQLPLMPKQFVYMKLKKSDTQVWKYITNLDSFSIPPRKSMSFRQFIDSWNPIEHSNPKSHTLLKLMAFSRGIKCGICGGVGLGKNADRTLKRHIYGKTSPKVKSPSKAKFYTELFYNDDVNLDEITSWKKEEVNIVEDIMAEYGDESPDLTKFSKDSNRLMECIKNINERSLTFTFNPRTEHNKFYVEEKFRNWDKIKDRYPILFLDGKVLGHYPRPTSAEKEAYIVQNMPTLKEIACNTAYYWLNLGKEVHNYDKSKISIAGRHLSNISPLFVACDAYSESQEEFDGWVALIQSAIKEFNTKYAKDAYSNNITVKNGQASFLTDVDLKSEFEEEDVI